MSTNKLFPPTLHQNNEFEVTYGGRLHERRRDLAEGAGGKVRRALTSDTPENGKGSAVEVLFMGPSTSSAAATGGKSSKMRKSDKDSSDSGDDNDDSKSGFFLSNISPGVFDTNTSTLTSDMMGSGSGKSGKTGGSTSKSSKKRTLPVCSKRLDIAWEIVVEVRMDFARLGRGNHF